MLPGAGMIIAVPTCNTEDQTLLSSPGSHGACMHHSLKGIDLPLENYLHAMTGYSFIFLISLKIYITKFLVSEGQVGIILFSALC